MGVFRCMDRLGHPHPRQLLLRCSTSCIHAVVTFPLAGGRDAPFHYHCSQPHPATPRRYASKPLCQGPVHALFVSFAKRVFTELHNWIGQEFALEMLHVRAGAQYQPSIPACRLTRLFNSKLGGFGGGRQQRGNRLLDAGALLRRITVKNLLNHTVAIHQI